MAGDKGGRKGAAVASSAAGRSPEGLTAAKPPSTKPASGIEGDRLAVFAPIVMTKQTESSPFRFAETRQRGIKRPGAHLRRRHLMHQRAADAFRVADSRAAGRTEREMGCNDDRGRFRQGSGGIGQQQFVVRMMSGHGAASIIDLMRRMQTDFHTTFIFSTHDPELMSHAEETFVIRDGELVQPETGRLQ